MLQLLLVQNTRSTEEYLAELNEKLSYYYNLCIKLKSNTKKLWNIVNQTIGKSNDKTCILDKFKIGNVTINNPREILNELATYFVNVGSKYANSINKSDCDVSDYLKKIKRNNNSLFLTPTNPTEVTSIISSLPNKTSSGYDHLNNKLLKEIKSEIATPLSIIFNCSLETGCFPTKMKYA